MKRTQTSSGRELVEIRLLSMMSIQEPDHVCDSFVIIHAVSLSSPRLRAHPLLAAIYKYFRTCEMVNLPGQAGRVRAPTPRSLHRHPDNPKQ